MQSKSKGGNRIEEYPYNISSSAVCSEPWWRNGGYTAISPAVIGGNASNSSSLEQSKDGQSQSDGGNEEDDDAIKQTQNTASPCSDGTYGREHHTFQHLAPTMPLRTSESLTQPPQLELVGHSIACASNPYSDPYYGGMMAAYGPQPLPYLHESRHQHAMRRARASGGRFAKKSEADTSKCMMEEKGKGCGPGISSQSASSSGSEPLPSDSTETLNGHQELGVPEVHKTRTAHSYVNASNQCQNYSSFQTSTHHMHQAAKGGEGDNSNQQWGSIPSNKASQKALAI